MHPFENFKIGACSGREAMRPPLYLRLASVIVPLPFGLALYAREKVRIRGALLIGAVTATLALLSMLTVTGLNDNVPIIPGPWIEWREAIEYAASIALAFVTGNILGSLIFQVVPKIMAGGGKPNAVAYNIAPGAAHVLSRICFTRWGRLSASS